MIKMLDCFDKVFAGSTLSSEYPFSCIFASRRSGTLSVGSVTTLVKVRGQMRSTSWSRSRWACSGPEQSSSSGRPPENYPTLSHGSRYSEFASTERSTRFIRRLATSFLGCQKSMLLPSLERHCRSWAGQSYHIRSETFSTLFQLSPHLMTTSSVVQSSAHGSFSYLYTD